MQYKDVDKWPKIPELYRLKDLKKPPTHVYCSLPFDSHLFQHCVAIVGSRQMTEYGRQAIEKLVPQLVMQHKTIVSGFMYGVDQYAHQTCLDCGGQTIAILGWGITTPLMGYDQTLAKRIIQTGGMLLSEWEHQPATLWTFPQRNRLVAALAEEVYVIEAAEKSGSLQTADLALKLHRPLWAIPGSITSRTSVGTNHLIATGQAKPWLGSQPKATSITNDPLLQLVAREPLTASDLARKLHRPIASVGSQLSLCTLTGQLVEREGKYYLP